MSEKRGWLSRNYRLIVLSGVDPFRLYRTIRRWIPFRARYKQFRSQMATKETVEFPLGPLYPCLEDRSSRSGVASGPYFHQDLWVAQRIFDRNPQKHIDVGSRIDGFVAHVASFREIEVVDIRPPPAAVRNVTFRTADFMAEDAPLKDACDSISCLHSLEHFGLGRYGDPIDVDGWRKGFRNLVRMLRTGGTFYLSLPIGPQRVEFDAHRVFDVGFVNRIVDGILTIERFVYVDDAGNLHDPADPHGTKAATNFGCRFGCGIWEMTKVAELGR